MERQPVTRASNMWKKSLPLDIGDFLLLVSRGTFYLLLLPFCIVCPPCSEMWRHFAVIVFNHTKFGTKSGTKSETKSGIKSGSFSQGSTDAWS